MSARRAVIIGCGTTGCEIAAQVYLNFKRYVEETGEDPEKVQFLLIDTQEPVMGAEELFRRGDYINISCNNANQQIRERYEQDPFFKTWWPDEYQFPSLFSMASSIPINGRFVFWTQLGAMANEGSFVEKFRQRIGPNYFNQGDQNEKILVFIVSTLCGGTGAGIFLDIAQVIKSMTDIDTEIHGLFLMDDVVNMRANQDAHSILSANTYGSLIALNYWQTPKEMREIDLGNFIQTPHVTLEGNVPPFDICYLISRDNTRGLQLRSFQDYQQISVDAISMMLFEEQAGYINDMFMEIRPRVCFPIKIGEKYEPLSFVLLSASTLSYHPEKAVEYLICELANRALDIFWAVPNDISQRMKEQAGNYIVQNELREVDDNGKRYIKNEVTDFIRNFQNPNMTLYTEMQKYIQDLYRSDMNTSLINALMEAKSKEGNLDLIIKRLKETVEAGLNGNIQESIGVNYHQLMKSNRKLLYEKAIKQQVERDISLPNQTTGLHQLVGWMLKCEFGNLVGVRRFLQILQNEIPKHRESLENELLGYQKRGIHGDRERLEWYEHSLDGALEKLKSGLSSIFNKKRIKTAKAFRDLWWNPWLSLKISIMAKDEGIAFYRALEQEIGWLLDLLEKDITEMLEDIRHNYDCEKAVLYGMGYRDNVHQKEETILDGQVLRSSFDDKVNDSLQLVNEGLSNLIVDQIAEFFADKERAITLLRHTIRDLKDSIYTFIKNEGEVLFGEDLRSISIWDSMVLGMEGHDDDEIKRVVEDRIQRLSAFCVPYFHTDPQFQQIGIFPHIFSWFAYDLIELEMFENKYGFQLNIQPPLSNYTGDNGRNSASELNITTIEVGVPLYFINPANSGRSAFERRLEISTPPCILDKRYMRLIRRGLPTWGPPFVGRPDEMIYFLLLAEHFGILESPLLSMTRSPYGDYKFESAKLKSTRSRAFEQLLPGGEFYASLFPTLKELVDLRRNEYSDLDWKMQNILCTKRLYLYLKTAPQSAAKDEVQGNYDTFISYLKRTYGFSGAEISELMEDDSIKLDDLDDEREKLN